MGHPRKSPEMPPALQQRRGGRQEDLLQPTCPDHENGTLIPVDVAIEKGLKLRPPVTTETIDLQHASERVLAQTLTAQAPQPRFDYSAMDGYAIDVEDIASSLPTKLRLIGRITANRVRNEITLKTRTTLRILTGAPIPPGANAVIAQEEVRREADIVVLSHLPRRGENIRLRGEDVRTGDTLIESGSLMDPRAMGIAASAGIARVELFRKLRVAIFSTGSELRQPGEDIAPGEIYNSNRYILRGLLDKPWIDLIDLGACHDEPKALRACMRDAAAQADVVITTGGVSVGDEDHMADVIRQCGGTIVVTKVAIKPGKPLTLGRAGLAAYIGLPGNPGAVFTTFRVVVERLLQAWAGLKQRAEPVRPVIADFTWTCRVGRATYLPGVLKGYNANGAPLVDVLPGANSGKLFLLSKAEGFVVIDSNCGGVRPGDLVGWFAL
jgi:molybdopterin molybdotransferase